MEKNEKIQIVKVLTENIKQSGTELCQAQADFKLIQLKRAMEFRGN